MLRNCFVALLLIATTQIYSQELIEGKVTDENGRPLIGASVFYRKSLQGTITDGLGKFTLAKTTNKSDSLHVSYLGYEDRIQAIETNNLTILLEEKKYLAQEVIVYGSRAGNSTPTAYTNIGKEELRKANTGNDITYMLSTSPSVVATSEAGIGLGYTAMRIRGTDATRINITMNGIPVNDAESQGVFWVNMPDFASSVSNVQIQRGVGTSSQGSGAFGASINFQTEGLSLEPYAEYQVIGGSFNTLRNTVKLGSGLINEHFSFDARLSKLNSDGYVQNSFSDHESIYLTGAYHAKNSLIRFTYLDGIQRTGISWWGTPTEMLDSIRTYNPAGIYYDKEGEEHYYKDQTDNYRQSHYQLHLSHKFDESLHLNLAGHYTRGGGHFEQFKDDTDFASYGLSNIIRGGDTITQTDLIRAKYIENDFYGVTASLIYRNRGLDATFGGGWNRYTGDHFGNILWTEENNSIPKDYQWYLNTGDKIDLNIFAKASYLITPVVSVFADVQLRHIDYSMEGFDDDLLEFEQEHHFNFFNPKAGIYFNLNSSNKAYASIAIAGREPTRANFKEAKGDPESTPKHETLYDFELGYKFASNILLAGVNLYYMQYKDQLVPTGEKSSVGYDIMTNVANSFRRGIELEGTIKPHEKVQWSVNLTLSQNKINNFTEYSTYYPADYSSEEIRGRYLGETDISYSPSIITSSTLQVNPVKDLHISLITQFVGKQYFDNTSSEDRKIDPYLINHLKLEYQVPVKFGKGLRVMCQINNLLDNEYINNAYGGNWYEDGQEMSWTYHFPQAGIHLFGGITLQF